FEAQKKCLSQNGYDIPSKLEAIIAVLAVKYLTGISIYSTRDDATRCSEKFNNNSYWAVGSDSSGSFCLYGPDSYILNDGVAAVIRS
ncbi:MAG: hypothetical protein ACRDFB_05940, partial [Rhabdochlamydiaceae bacterium]